MDAEKREEKDIIPPTIKRVLTYEVKTEERAEQERTTKKKALFLDYFEQGMGIIQYALDAAGIKSRQTYHTWLDTDPAFRRECERIKHLQVFAVEDKLLKAIIKDESWAISLYLSRRHPDYRPKQENYLIPTQKTLEDLLDEYQNNETITGQQIPDRIPYEDSEQARIDRPVQNEPSPALLLEPKNAPQPDPESSTEGNLEIH